MTRYPIRVMLVDDHQTMLWGLERLIESEHPKMEVVGLASNCEEAREKAAALLPDVILLDLDLEGKNSLDHLADMLSNGVSRALILTADRQQSTLDQAVLLGARGVLRKIAPAEQVLKAIEKVHQGEMWVEREMLVRVFGKLTSPATQSAPDPESTKIAQLTPRERMIIDTIVRENGASNKVIAQRLFISEHTLRNHLTSIYQKLGLGNRLELYIYAVKHALHSPSQDLQAGATRQDSPGAVLGLTMA